jgi:formylglycine-generating enzyme required for sulfatase activity
MSEKTYAVFLSYNSEDREAVENIAVYLHDKANLKPWFDKWELIPGEPWVDKLDRGLTASNTCAVFVGKSGEGPWQKKEVGAALDRQVKNPEFRVIPVLLPGAPQKPELPKFLAGNTWVEFRKALDDDDAFWRLECGIQGIAPGRGRPGPAGVHRSQRPGPADFQAKVAPTPPAEGVIIANPAGYELVRIPGGAFRMGSPETEEGRFDDEGPLHKVRVADFYMGRYPVTNEQYERFLRANPGAAKPAYWADRSFNQPRQPVVGVSWEEAQRYAEWARLRLPTEAEWEYACRAGTHSRFYTGDTEGDLDRAGWYAKNSGNQLHPAGEKEPNPFGLYDMHGNVWEWVEDDRHGSYQGAPDDGSAWVDHPRSSIRVLRGGSWSNDASLCRSALRINVTPDGRSSFVGFRLSRSVAPDP